MSHVTHRWLCPLANRLSRTIRQPAAPAPAPAPAPTPAPVPAPSPVCPPTTIGFIIPCYKTSEADMWLTVSSILTQQDVDGVSMEIIVSADGHEYAHTVEAIADRAAKALRGAGRDRYCRCCTVRAISSWHGGIANARNHGLAMLPPSTQWVQPIDGGDTIVSTFISQALQLATADPRINVVMPSLCVETGYKW